MKEAKAEKQLFDALNEVPNHAHGGIPNHAHGATPLRRVSTAGGA